MGMDICKNPLPEAASSFILRKSCLTNRRNGQHETFTPVKCAKQPY